MDWDINPKRNKAKIRKALALLGEPRIVKYDPNLISEVDRARYQWPNYCDAHWIFQVEATYRSSAGQAGVANITAAACEQVIQISLRLGPEVGKKQAEKLHIFGVPSWVSFDQDDARWLEVRRERLRQIKATRDGD